MPLMELYFYPSYLVYLHVSHPFVFYPAFSCHFVYILLYHLSFLFPCHISHRFLYWSLVVSPTLLHYYIMLTLNYVYEGNNCNWKIKSNTRHKLTISYCSLSVCSKLQYL